MGAGTLIFFCGKMGAGKSTYAQQLARKDSAILISEDEWLATLYPQQIHTIKDYLRCSAQLKNILSEHISLLLKSGLTLILDFPGNTIEQRHWFKDIINRSQCQHRLICLNHSDERCLKQLAQRRNEQPQRAAFDNEATFYHLSQFFQLPTEEEGFILEWLQN